MLKISSLLPAVAVFSIALAADAGDFKMKSSNAKFSTSVLQGGVNITGTCNPLSVKKGKSDKELVLSTSLASLKTGITARDEAAQKDLAPSGNKEITFTVDRSTLKMPEAGKPVKGAKGKGSFVLNKVPHDYAFTYDAAVGKDGIDVNGKMTIDFTKHGIEKICLVLVCVKHEIALDVGFTLNE